VRRELSLLPPGTMRGTPGLFGEPKTALVKIAPFAGAVRQSLRETAEQQATTELFARLHNGDLSHVVLVASRADPGDLDVTLKSNGSQDWYADGTPDGWLKVLREGGVNVDSAEAQTNRMASIRVHVEAPRYSLGYLMEQAAREKDLAYLATLDRLALGDESVTAPALWSTAVRILSYSASSRTLSVRPADPLAQFNIKLYGRAPVSPLDQAHLRLYLRNAETVVGSGDELEERISLQIATTDRQLIVHSPHSANRTYQEIARAAALGNRSFASRSAVILDGLPSPTWGPLGMWQLYSMKLDTTLGDEWRKLRENLDFEKFGAQAKIRTADSRIVLDELKSGQDDLLILVAHNDGKTIYFPNGKALAINDVEQLQRPKAPNRAIVLITCEAGGTGGEAASLAEILLRNRLATTVFASPRAVDAEQLPEFLNNLAHKPMREALDSLGIRQIVSLSPESRVIGPS